jgi:hypothetical protein
MKVGRKDDVCRKKSNAQPDQLTREMAMYIAMVVRNAMEDFHSRHLSDEQMRELNPIIRNAICTALHAAGRCNTSAGARAFLTFHQRMIPRYWEPPVLLDDLLAMEAQLDGHDG